MKGSILQQSNIPISSVQPYPSIAAPTSTSSMHFSAISDHTTITSAPTTTPSHQNAQVSSSHVGSIISSPIESQSATRHHHPQSNPQLKQHQSPQHQHESHLHESHLTQSHSPTLQQHEQQHQKHTAHQQHHSSQQPVLKQHLNQRSGPEMHHISKSYDTSTQQTHYSGTRPEITPIASPSPNVSTPQDAAAVSVSYAPLSSQQVVHGSSGAETAHPQLSSPLYAGMSGKLSHVPMGSGHHHQSISTSVVGSHSLLHQQQQHHQQPHHQQTHHQQPHHRYSARAIKTEQIISSMPPPMHPDPVQPFQATQDVNEADRPYAYNRHSIFEEFANDENHQSAATAGGNGGGAPGPTGASGALPPPGPSHDNDHASAVGTVDGSIGGHLGGHAPTSSMMPLSAITGTHGSGPVGQHGGGYGGGGSGVPNSSSGGGNTNGNMMGNEIGDNVGMGVNGMGMNVGMGMNMNGGGSGGGNTNNGNGMGGMGGIGMNMNNSGASCSGGSSVGSGYPRKMRTMPRTRAQQMTESQRKQRHNEHTRASRSRIDRGLERLKAVIKRVRPQQKVNKKADVLHEAVKLLKEGFQLPRTESDEEQEPQESSLSV